jgi:hypothetical protein
MTARNPTTFIVGAGPVATALAGALRLGGVPVLGLWARRAPAARAAGSAAGVAAFSSAPPDILLETEVVILAVRDQMIGQVAEMLVGTGLINKRHVLLHCAGAASAAEVLGNVADRIAGIGTMHPLSAIADGKLAMRALKGTVFGVEGDEIWRATATKLVTALGGLTLVAEQMAAHARPPRWRPTTSSPDRCRRAVLASGGLPERRPRWYCSPRARCEISPHGTTGGSPGRSGAAMRHRAAPPRRLRASELAEIPALPAAP